MVPGPAGGIRRHRARRRAARRRPGRRAATTSRCSRAAVRAPRRTLVTHLPEPPDRASSGNPWYDALPRAGGVPRRSTDFDVVHDHAGVIGPVCGAMLGGSPPVVHTLHGPWTDEARLLYEPRRTARAPRRDQRRAAPPRTRRQVRGRSCTTASTRRVPVPRRRRTSSSSTSGARTPTRDRWRRSASRGRPAAR